MAVTIKRCGSSGRGVPVHRFQNLQKYPSISEETKERVRRAMAELGYERMPQVDGMGQFSVRGGILDIYPLTEELPVRIELWDTEVDSIRTFDLESQRSIEQLDEIDIYPATEIVLTKKQAKEGVEWIRSEAKSFAEKLRSQQNTEEAYRITGIVKELTEGIEEGWKQTGLDDYDCCSGNSAGFTSYGTAGRRPFRNL